MQVSRASSQLRSRAVFDSSMSNPVILPTGSQNSAATGRDEGNGRGSVGLRMVEVPAEAPVPRPNRNTLPVLPQRPTFLQEIATAQAGLRSPDLRQLPDASEFDSDRRNSLVTKLKNLLADRRAVVSQDDDEPEPDEFDDINW